MCRQAPLVLLIWVGLGCCGGEPSIDSDAILRPSFETAEGVYAAGTAFLVEDEANGTLMITAQHLFGPSGGMPADIRAADLPDRVWSASATAAMSGDPVVEGARPLLLEGAEPASDQDASADVAAFAVPAGVDAPRLTVAGKTPAAGDPVWLLAQAASGAPESRHLHRATVVEVERGGLVYRYRNPVIGLQATSGAAIVNRAGEVVGINAWLTYRDQQLHGVATPIGALHELLPP